MADFDDLRILKAAEDIADSIWKAVTRWDEFARDTLGKQLARAADSIGANIAEAYGRHHYGEKLQFLYYARGSLFETKFWLNRARARELMTPTSAQDFVTQLTALARQLNTFMKGLKDVRANDRNPKPALREPTADYAVDLMSAGPEALFDESDLAWLAS
jgi:four helix bundle protein